MEYINRLLHRSRSNPPSSRSPTPTSGNGSPLPKTAEHEVKVCFAREFADVGSIAVPTPDSLSSASSFHTLSSNLSTKCDSPDYIPNSLEEISNTSYVNTDISDINDLILGCTDIQLNREEDLTYATHCNSQDLSQDQTFSSAVDEPILNTTKDFVNHNEKSETKSPEVTNVIQDNELSQESIQLVFDQTQDICDPLTLSPNNLENSVPVALDVPAQNNTTQSINESTKESTLTEDNKSVYCANEISNSSIKDIINHNVENADANIPVNTSFKKPDVEAIAENSILKEDTNITTSLISNSILCPLVTSIQSVNTLAEHVECPSLPSLSSISSLENVDIQTNEVANNNVTNNVTKQELKSLSNLEDVYVNGLKTNPIILMDKEVSLQKIDSDPDYLKNSPTVIVDKHIPEVQEETKLPELLITEKCKTIEEIDITDAIEQEKQFSDENLDDTLTLQDVCMNLVSLPEIEQYETFKPQRQSTSAPLIEQRNFDKLKLAAEEVANDIFKSSLEFTESDNFISATSDIFQDPGSFDFLLKRSNSKNSDRLRAESLYVKFDPLVSNISMLPQGNSQSVNEEQNGKNEISLPTPGTPKLNPAIAAIDRLLFYSPLPSSTVQKAEKTPEKNEQPVEESKPDAAVIADINMSKELELVRATVLQLEEELEKQKSQYELELEKRKKEYEVDLEKQKKEYEGELEKHRNAFQERITKLQAQLTQEMKTKTQMTVVVEEYEKSISRLLTEGERDRTNLEQEKTKLQEELQAANYHLTNTEAAFNDVHSKYERLKGVVSAYKSNETVLKESIQENIETIKALENRYEQLKSHAMAQLEKANLELDAIRKQHEAETVKLHAMVRKAELKSNSLAELVEQKTKENKELTQILDEVIARVGHQNAE